MTTAATKEPTPVPVLPRASEVRAVVEAVAEGLKFLTGLAVAIERVEAKAQSAADADG